MHSLWILRTSLQWHDKREESGELWCPEGIPLQMPVDGGRWCDMMAAIALYDDDDEARWLGGWQERWKRDGRAAVGGSIYMEDPYLSNLLAARPARQRPRYLESRAKAYLCPSLTLYSLAAFQKTTGWGKYGKRGMNVTRGDWSRVEVLQSGRSWRLEGVDVGVWALWASHPVAERKHWCRPPLSNTMCAAAKHE